LVIGSSEVRTPDVSDWQSSTSRVAAKNAGFAGGPKGEGVARVISPGAPFYYLNQAIIASRLAGFFVAVQ